MPAFTTPRLLVTVLAIGALIPGAAVVPAQAARKPLPWLRNGHRPTARPSWRRAGWTGCRHPSCGGTPATATRECATARLPLDYDRPHGATTLVAVLRVKAKDQKHRIGSLFVNPGGPGGSGTGLAQAAPYFLSPDVLARFDVVGIDPRGTNFSDEVACFPGNAQQGKVLSGLNVAFPFTKAEEQAAVSSSKGLGKACSTTGKPLSAAMSTAEVARDMDVIRRGVGDKRLSYLGFSYGSYLGQVYANLFPDRVRAVAIDGVLDPVAWAGTKATASQPQGDRIRSADGATKALHQILVLCDKAGGQKCRFSPGNPVVNYDVVAGRLKAKPLVFTDPDTGDLVTFTYADLVSGTLGSLYGPYGYLEITGNLADLIILTEPPAKASSPAARARRAKAVRSFAREARCTEEAGWQPRRLELPLRQHLRGRSRECCAPTG